jgi:hypothetical protein
MVTIEHSKPFRMHKPKHQADFFRLLAHVLCYLYSGNNDAGYISKNEWNPYWRDNIGLNVRPDFFSC